MHVHGILGLPSVAGICISVRSMSVIMKVATSFFGLDVFNVSFLYFYSGTVVDCYAAGLKKKGQMGKDPL